MSSPTRLTSSVEVLSYPSAMTVSTRALTTVTDLLRRHRTGRATRWRKLSVGRQALLVPTYLRRSETHTDLAGGSGIRTSTVYRYLARPSACSPQRPRPPPGSLAGGGVAHGRSDGPAYGFQGGSMVERVATTSAIVVPGACQEPRCRDHQRVGEGRSGSCSRRCSGSPSRGASSGSPIPWTGGGAHRRWASLPGRTATAMIAPCPVRPSPPLQRPPWPLSPGTPSSAGTI